MKLGAEQSGDSLIIQITADSEWEGMLYFDKPRYKEIMNLPSDYPRINQFPEWFTVGKGESIQLINIGDDKTEHLEGDQITSGIPIVYSKDPLKLIAVKK